MISRRILRTGVLAVAGALLVYAVSGFLVVPAVLKWQLLKNIRERLGRPASLASTRFNPFTLELRLAGFDMRDRDSSALASFDTLVINLGAASLVRRAVDIEEFRLIRPAGVVRVNAAGNLAAVDLFQRDSTMPVDTARSAPPRLLVEHLLVADGSVQYVDESRTPRYEESFKDLTLNMEGLSTIPNEKGDHVLTVNFASGAQLRWEGKNVVEPLQLEGTLELSNVRLAKVSEVFGRAYPLIVTDGRGAATLPYSITQGPDRGLVATLSRASYRISGLTARPPGADSEWVRLPSVEVDGVSLEWPRRAATIDLVLATDPWIRAAREANGTLNWSHIIEAMPADTAAPDTAPAWNAVIKTVEMRNGSASIADRAVRPAANFAITDANLSMGPVGSDSTMPAQLEWSAVLGKGTRLSGKGSMTRFPKATDMELGLTDLDLRMVKPYLPPIPVQLAGGRVSVNGRARMTAGRPATTFDGRARIDRLAVNDSTGQPLLAWKRLSATGIRYTQGPDLLRIRKVELDQPFARIAISRDRTMNLMQLVPADTTSREFPYEILDITFANGEVDFSDESLILPFRTRIDSTHGSIKDVASFGGTAGTLEMEGQIEDYGLARASGTIRINDPFAATDIKAAFRNINMATLTPYSAQFAGYAISAGRLDIDMDYRVKDRMLQADHRIIATNLTLGDKVEGGESPGFLVKLAISLMKDKDGKIKLDVPVEGTVDDPQFSYKGIVWQAMKQMLGKVATAPFRFLGKLLGIGGDDIELVDFDPGRSDLIPPEQQKLDSLVAELGRKPELTLSVEGRYDSISDTRAIRELKLERKIQAQRDSSGKKAAADTSTSRLARILEKLYENQRGKASLDSMRDAFRTAADADTAKKGRKYDPGPFYTALREQLTMAETVEPGELQSLGKARGDAIVTALTAGGSVEASRVSATDPQPVKKKKSGSSRVPSEMAMDAK